MNIFDDKYFSIINAHYLSSDGKLSSTRYEADFVTHQLVSKRPVSDVPDVNFNFTSSLDSTTGLNLGSSAPPDPPGAVMIYEVASTVDLDLNKRKFKFNIPNMIRCQNCETNYPTKYQYQRHQCEFNAEKVVLKPNADFADMEKGKRIKYDCSTCGKQFVSKSNLERHQSSHESSKDNTCEHCKKQFVSENRLRIHKENHCKKAGDISKFYRSDVTVWKCKKCHEVFSSCATASFHIEHCTQQLNLERFVILNPEDIKKEPESQQQATLETNTDGFPVSDNKAVDKISTEILLQCEFCNRTYADKQILLKHQKTHKTDKNYECVVCKESFDSYITASQHWIKKCSEKANLFYLPKLTYCEFCDRTFKSHEILYTHKIKKKHYTPKFHLDNEEVVVEKLNNHNKDIKNEEVIDKLIEDVLIALEIPLNKRTVNKKSAPIAVPADEDMMNSSSTTKENIDPDDITVKTEPNQSNEDDIQESDMSEKKKRGRKRKLPKQTLKVKKPLALEDGYKYQCERCIQVWETITALEEHREKEHAANFNCDECGQVLHSARALLIHSRAHKSLKPYVCETCGRSYSQTSHLWQHMRFHQGIKPFACPHEGCEARYTIRPDLKDHIRKVHTRERPFKCNVCGKCFLTGSVYYQHRLIHTEDRRYGCDMCEKRFFRADALNNHKRIHTNERPYPCFVCGRLFRQKGDRNKHFRTQHPDAIDTDIKNKEVIDKFIKDVPVASKILLNKGTFDKKSTSSVVPTDEDVFNSSSNKENADPDDFTIETVPKKKRGRKRKLPKKTPKVKKSPKLEDGYKYQCELCAQVWETISALEEHREKNHAANFNCDDCRKTLQSARALLIHNRTHKGMKPYLCEMCGASYSQTSHLWQHMRFHQGIKPFACSHEGCEARYTLRQDLKDHIRKVHTRERPFKCNVCGKCFLTGSVYYQHRYIHTDRRRYGCDMCEKRFIRTEALKNHKRIHTNEKPYPCFVCGRQFRQKSQRDKHFRTQHSHSIEI